MVAAGGALSAGCDDPPPPNPAGAFLINFRDSGAECSLASHDAALGTVGASGDPELVPNGQDDSSVECRVEPSGSAFRVSLDLDAGATGVVQVNVTLSADNTPDAKATGTVIYASKDTAGNAYSSPSATPCEFWVDPDAGQFVRAGEVWLSFSCSTLSASGQTCALAESYAAARNCLGASNEDDEES